MTDPILVIHGVANRDEHAFRARVAGLEQTFAGRYRLKPVYWGDLGANSDLIDDTLPVLEEVRAVEQIEEETIRAIAFGLLANTPAPVPVDNGGVRSDRAVIAARAELVAAAASGQSTPFGAQPSIRGGELGRLSPDLAANVYEAVAEEFPKLTWLTQIADPEVLAVVGSTAGQAVGEQLSPATAQEEVRGLDVRRFVKNRLHELDTFTGSLIGKVGGSLNDAMRRQRGEGVARFLGDVLVYQRQRDAIHDRVRMAAAEIGPDVGNAERPVQVIGHSLGGVIAFDLAVAADPPLHTKALLTFGSQSPLFHLIDPRSPKLVNFALGRPVQLPATLSSWRNLWEPMDPLAFVAGKVFRLANDMEPEDTRVEHLASFGLWTHSVYWETTELVTAVRDSFK